MRLAIDALVGVAQILAADGVPQLAHQGAAQVVTRAVGWKETVATPGALFDAPAHALVSAAEQAARRGRSSSCEELADRALQRVVAGSAGHR